ncbi:sarcosine oxidase subunit alpha family protein [Roseomonas aerophila]|uniref:Sarcosine oxidase subunit alpha family protein n=1 Tax=Teichococcus aerophilus TaxID=1224513 RepID=A0ABR7RMD0_9PROT|nr:sarcosine oxidase subunit alpha family protein [Pseudoroseomonas aerophila]MBC9207704.1 sarcosine oxidase subunit alpha family protein [Pseudoroseomonas aerophila]
MGANQLFRLGTGGSVDRGALLHFTFDGRGYTGYRGDTLASALLANGVRLVGRSFKYHRPRGILSAGPEEPNALVELRGGARREPNTRATMAELFEGMAAVSQNRWPSLGFDLMGVNQLFAPILAAGFYYKTFMWPAAFWEKVYEPLIRRAAGLGRAAGVHDPDHYEKCTTHCDVLVVGAGPTGLMAALAAVRSGARVVLCEEDALLGGRLLSDRRMIDGRPALDWVREAVAELEATPDCRILPRTSVFGVFDGAYGAVERVADHLAVPDPFQPRQRLWRIVAKRQVLAAGSIERPLVFGDNDRPGVMLAGAVRSYINRYGVAPGRRAVVFANNDDATGTVADLHAAGVAVVALVDARAEPSEAVRRMAEAAGAALFAGGAVTRVQGRLGLRGVEVTDAAGRRHALDCDLLAVSGGWSPTVHLTSHHGGKPVWDEARAAFLPPERLPPGMGVAGAAAGAFSLAECLAAGARAGAEAAGDAGFQTSLPALPATEEESTAVRPLWRVRGGRGKAFVDYQNDVGDADVALAQREGFRSIEHLKRYTTLGMATDQGKTSNVNGVALMAELSGQDIARTGTTTFRPPFTPVALGALAGHHRGRDFKPTRLTPTHDWAKEQGAVFVETGYWLRAQYFPRAGEADWLETVTREARTVREAVGICDVTTLGKIDIQGPDAATLLERVYINSWKNLPVGRARYGVMLREDGMVMDDGTTARLAEDRFVMTTTTVNAAKVAQHLEFCQQWLWPELDVQTVSVTEQWAQLAVAGPQSRAVMEKIVDAGFDVSDAAFPYMSCAELTVCGGVPGRLFRLSFSGERAYEIAVPARYGDALARRLMQAGAPFGIIPYGTEALGVLRVEKGHAAGNELNGQTTAGDLGLGRMMSKKKDFFGRAMAQRPGLVDPARPVLMGFRPVDRAARLRAGAHFLPLAAEKTAAHDQGYMTSVAFSPTLGHWIGLGLIAHGPQRLGEVVRAWDPVRGGDIEVEIVSPVFVDPEGVRLHG